MEAYFDCADTPPEEFIKLVRKSKQNHGNNSFSQILYCNLPVYMHASFSALCFNGAGTWNLAKEAAAVINGVVPCISRSEDMHRNSVKMCGGRPRAKAYYNRDC
jgi:hypothetical protein